MRVASSSYCCSMCAADPKWLKISSEGNTPQSVLDKVVTQLRFYLRSMCVGNALVAAFIPFSVFFPKSFLNHNSFDLFGAALTHSLGLRLSVSPVLLASSSQVKGTGCSTPPPAASLTALTDTLRDSQRAAKPAKCAGNSSQTVLISDHSSVTSSSSSPVPFFLTAEAMDPFSSCRPAENMTSHGHGSFSLVEFTLSCSKLLCNSQEIWKCLSNRQIRQYKALIGQFLCRFFCSQ